MSAVHMILFIKWYWGRYINTWYGGARAAGTSAESACDRPQAACLDRMKQPQWPLHDAGLEGMHAAKFSRCSDAHDKDDVSKEGKAMFLAAHLHA
jgi:hypothetical protein